MTSVARVRAVVSTPRVHALAILLGLCLVGVLPARAVPLDTGPGSLPIQRIPPELERAVAALRGGDAEQAHGIARTYIAARPGSAVGHEILGEAAMALERWSDAERALTEALRLEPDRTSAVVRLGQVALGVGSAPKGMR